MSFKEGSNYKKKYKMQFWVKATKIYKTYISNLLLSIKKLFYT